MAISLLKRYKNEIDAILSKTKKRLYVNSVNNSVNFTVKCPWNSKENSYSKSLSFGGNISFSKLLKVEEDNGLVYIGIDLDKSVKNSFLDYSFNKNYNYLSLNNVDRVACYLFRDMLVDEFRYLRDKCGESRNLKEYSGELVLENYKNYIDGGIFEEDADGNVLCKEVGYWNAYNFLDKFIENNYKNSMVKDNKYYKRFVNTIEDFYNNVELRLADGEFPKLSNRNFLPILVIDFDKDLIVYLYKSGLTDRAGTDMYRKGLNREGVQYFIQSGARVVPFVNTIALNFGGKDYRMNNYEHVYIYV